MALEARGVWLHHPSPSTTRVLLSLHHFRGRANWESVPAGALWVSSKRVKCTQSLTDSHTVSSFFPLTQFLSLSLPPSLPPSLSLSHIFSLPHTHMQTHTHTHTHPPTFSLPLSHTPTHSLSNVRDLVFRFFLEHRKSYQLSPLLSQAWGNQHPLLGK